MNKRQVDIYSNVFFLVPLILSILFKLYPMVPVIVLVFIFSIIHHVNPSEFLRNSDDALAYILIISNLWITDFGIKNSIAGLGLAIGFIAIFIFHYDEDHKYRHGIWHLLSAIITCLCLISYYIG